jgi:hypothetical protein
VPALYPTGVFLTPVAKDDPIAASLRRPEMTHDTFGGEDGANTAENVSGDWSKPAA